MARGIWIRRVLACAAVLVLGGCAQRHSYPEPSQSQLMSSAPTTTSASAISGIPMSTASTMPPSAVSTGSPPGPFPDLGRFTEVDGKQYILNQQYKSKFVFFRPPSQQFLCGFGYKKELTSSVGITCAGAIPGIPPPAPGTAEPPPPDNAPCKSPHLSAGWDAHGNIQREGWGCLGKVPPGNVLPPGKKIVFGNITCVEGQDDLTGCLIKTDDGATHGFVISQQRTWTF
jgi:hypothetical protein